MYWRVLPHTLHYSTAPLVKSFCLYVERHQFVSGNRAASVTRPYVEPTKMKVNCVAAAKSSISENSATRTLAVAPVLRGTLTAE